jgi:hypothetical protein
MMEVMIIAAAVWAGMWAQRVLNRITQEAHAELAEEELDQILCTVEWIGDQCYLYRKDTNEFLGQGDDLEQIVDRLEQRGLEGCYLIPKEMATKPEQIQP